MLDVKQHKCIDLVEEEITVNLVFSGAHRFYVGKTGSAIAMLLTGGGCGIWTLCDLIAIILGNFTDVNGQGLE